MSTSKVKIKADPIPEMPDSPEEILNGAPSSPSIGSESPETEEIQPAISEALAGDLIGLPFEAWHLIQPAADPLSPEEKERLAGPFARILEKYGLGKIAKDEIILGFYLTAVVYGRIKAVREENARRSLADEVQKG